MPFIVIGRVARAHGVRGELAVRVDDPASSVLLEVPVLRLGGEPQPRRIASARAASHEVLLRLEGLDSRTEAEKLRGRDVEVEGEALPPPEPGEYYFRDLVGMQVADESGAVLGALKGVWETGPAPVLVIGEGASELLIPFAEPFVREVDVAGRRMVVRVPEVVE